MDGVTLRRRRGELVTLSEIVDVLWTTARRAARPTTWLELVSRLLAAFGSSVVLGGRDGYRFGASGRPSGSRRGRPADS